MSGVQKPHSERVAAIRREMDRTPPRGPINATLRVQAHAALDDLVEQLEAERGLADVFRRVLAQSHSLSGMSLMISGQTVEITEQEFDLVWDALDEIDGEDYTVRLSNPASNPPDLAKIALGFVGPQSAPAGEPMSAEAAGRNAAAAGADALAGAERAAQSPAKSREDA